MVPVSVRLLARQGEKAQQPFFSVSFFLCHDNMREKTCVRRCRRTFLCRSLPAGMTCLLAPPSPAFVATYFTYDYFPTWLPREMRPLFPFTSHCGQCGGRQKVENTLNSELTKMQLIIYVYVVAEMIFVGLHKPISYIFHVKVVIAKVSKRLQNVYVQKV